MPAIDLIRFIRAQHVAHWDNCVPNQAYDIRKALGDPDFDPSVITKALGDYDTPPAPFVRLLKEPAVLERFAKLLKIPVELLTSAEIPAVHDYLNGLSGIAPKAEGPARPRRFPLDRVETAALEKLADVVVKRSYPWVNWTAPYEMGARFLAGQCLPNHEQIAATYSRVAVLRPSDMREPYAFELGQLARELGVAPANQFGARLFDALAKNKILVILCNAERLADKSAWDRAALARGLVVRAGAVKNDWKGPAVVLTVGSAGHLESLIRVDNRHDVSRDLEGALTVEPDDRRSLFEWHWLRSCALRGDLPTAEIGSRVKRSHWHYQTAKGVVFPMNIRLRAFFASNLSNHSYSDPTQGFAALSGVVKREERDTWDGENLPTDVAYFREDVRDHLGRLPPDSRGTAKKGFRFVSTAKHWLTEVMLEELCRGVGRFDAVRSALRGKHSVVAYDDTPPDGPHYIAGIGMKAVLQDEWMKTDRLGRARAHYLIARRLWREQNNRELLASEFPYQPSWGRSRIFFLTECIRHLMRACSIAEEGDVEEENLATAEPAEQLLDEGEDFPVEPPSEKWDGCNPRQVLSFCFRTIYLKRLNGTTRRDAGARALTKRNGAYPLALEMLQLMSGPEGIGTPHWALPESERRLFTTETGFAALNLGDLETADDCFGSLAWGDRTGLDAKARADDLLNLSLVHLARSELVAARALTDEAVATLDAAYSDATMPETMERRLLGRQAYLAFLDRDYSSAAALFHKLDTSSEGLTDPDLVDAYAKSLAALRDDQRDPLPDTLPDAFDVAVERTFQTLGEGQQHEGMGYKITLAHILRERGMLSAAETVLNDVHKGIATFGGSERTYLAFMIEAGRVLIARGKPVLAFCSYLLPGLRRARGKGLGSFAETALHFCLDALDRTVAMAERDKDATGESSGQAWSAMINQVRSHSTAYQQKLERARPPDLDPLDGYEIVSPESLMGRHFSSAAAVEAFRRSIVDRGGAIELHHAIYSDAEYTVFLEDAKLAQ